MSEDLSKYADTQFYAGRPKVATADELSWASYNFDLTVREESGILVATMNCGNCEWKTPIDPANLKEEIDEALEDSCDLGRTANWSNDE